MHGIPSSNLTDTFDRVVVLNLARRPERLQHFWSVLKDWPFKTPERVEAVDGHAIGAPAGWDKGAGAWGCLLSHRMILDRAIADGLNSILLLEDDAYPARNFGALAADFLMNVPADWDGLMFGAEHLAQPQSISNGVVRCVLSNRTHAYAIRGRMMQTLSEFWRNTTNDHCDIVLASLMGHFKVYAPTPLLIGQHSGQSDITGLNELLRFLSPEQKTDLFPAIVPHPIKKMVLRLPAKQPVTLRT